MQPHQDPGEHSQVAKEILDAEDRELFLDYLWFVALIVLIAVLGAISNMVCVYVVRMRFARETISVYLTVLAGVDLLYCIAIIPSQIFHLRHLRSLPSVLAACSVDDFLVTWADGMTTLILLGVAVDRATRLVAPDRPATGTRTGMRAAWAACATSALLCSLVATLQSMEGRFLYVTYGGPSETEGFSDADVHVPVPRRTCVFGELSPPAGNHEPRRVYDFRVWARLACFITTFLVYLLVAVVILLRADRLGPQGEAEGDPSLSTIPELPEMADLDLGTGASRAPDAAAGRLAADATLASPSASWAGGTGSSVTPPHRLSLSGAWFHQLNNARLMIAVDAAVAAHLKKQSVPNPDPDPDLDLDLIAMVYNDDLVKDALQLYFRRDSLFAERQKFFRVSVPPDPRGGLERCPAPLGDSQSALLVNSTRRAVALGAAKEKIFRRARLTIKEGQNLLRRDSVDHELGHLARGSLWNTRTRFTIRVSRHTIAMMFVVSVDFFLASLPSTILLMTRGALSGHGGSADGDFSLPGAQALGRYAVYTLVRLHALALKPILYAIVNPTFRRHFPGLRRCVDLLRAARGRVCACARARAPSPPPWPLVTSATHSSAEQAG